MHRYLYGGDQPNEEAAMKAAGLELQGLGLVSVSCIKELHTPLMALVSTRLMDTRTQCYLFCLLVCSMQHSLFQ